MQKFCLIGEKLDHSYSPALHKQIMKQLDIEGSYDLIEISQENFEESFRALCKQGYDGMNVTIPYKEKVIPYLDELSTEAKYIGAVNTISFKHGKLIGHNTDYLGFRAMLEKAQISVKGKDAVILGTGGAAKAILKALLDMGICDLTVVSRSKIRFHNQYAISYEFFRENHTSTDLIINCTPVGMSALTHKSPLEKQDIHASIAVDLIYNPTETLFLKYARQLGLVTMNGSVMLEEQARESQKIWNS